MEPLLIKNARIVEGGALRRVHLKLGGGVIKQVVDADSVIASTDRTIDAEERLVIPAGIDPHVHLQLPTPAGPSSDDFRSGSKAALAGGTTTVVDFVTPGRGESLKSALAKRRTEALNATVTVGLHMGITWWDASMPAQMKWCVEQGGISSFKVYLAYRSTIGISLDQLRQAMIAAAVLNVVIAIHAEDGPEVDRLRQMYIGQGKCSPRYHVLSRPPETELTAVSNVIRLVRETRCTVYFVHISTAAAARLIWKAKEEGLPVLAETCTQYLALNDGVYQGSFDETAPYVISPPLRSAQNVEELWYALTKGVFDVVSTDHCPFHLHGQKDAGRDNFTLIPNGAGGIEFRLQLLYALGVKSGRIGLQQWVDLCSAHAAQIFHFETKGKIAAGFDADLVIWNESVCSVASAKTQVQRCDSNIYEGMNLAGRADLVLLGGEIRVVHGQVVPPASTDKFIAAKI